ncbi:MAG TPA: creatininase family protein [bacterium]|nr:creatininase family protein [bacterium]
MSLAEAEERLATTPVVLFPFGALEAHGPHLPLGADYLVAEEIALRASRRTNAVVAPAMAYGYAPHFQGFAGSVSTRMEITRMLAEDVVTDLAAAGVTHFVFIDNHAGNDAPLEVAARAVQDRLGIAVAHFYPWRVMSTWGPELFGDDWKTVYGHGAEPNTSVLLYLMPETVRMDRAVPGELARYRGQKLASSRYVEIDRVQSQLYLRVKDVNASSVTGGDPTRRPDPAIGRALVEQTADALVRLVDWFRTQPAAGRP